jgi:hypothetical protein
MCFAVLLISASVNSEPGQAIAISPNLSGFTITLLVAGLV